MATAGRVLIRPGLGSSINGGKQMGSLTAELERKFCGFRPARRRVCLVSSSLSALLTVGQLIIIIMMVIIITLSDGRLAICRGKSGRLDGTLEVMRKISPESADRWPLNRFAAAPNQVHWAESSQMTWLWHVPAVDPYRWPIQCSLYANNSITKANCGHLISSLAR